MNIPNVMYTKSLKQHPNLATSGILHVRKKWIIRKFVMKMQNIHIYPKDFQNKILTEEEPHTSIFVCQIHVRFMPDSCQIHSPYHLQRKLMNHNLGRNPVSLVRDFVSKSVRVIGIITLERNSQSDGLKGRHLFQV